MGTGSLALLDWRRRVHELYASVRAVAAGGDPAGSHALWRAGRDALFATHPQSPLRPGDPRRHHGLPVGRYDPSLRVVAELVPDGATGAGTGAGPGAGTGPVVIDVETGTDGTVRFTRLGSLALPQGHLDVWWLGGYGGGVWLPVRDRGSGSLSYGGGRYLLDTAKGADLGSHQAGRAGDLVVDLNFLYPPSCAYDEAWACPLPPPGNHLDAVLEAGELLPGR